MWQWFIWIADSSIAGSALPYVRHAYIAVTFYCSQVLACLNELLADEMERQAAHAAHMALLKRAGGRVQQMQLRIVCGAAGAPYFVPYFSYADVQAGRRSS